jgi:hypothetical protein
MLLVTIKKIITSASNTKLLIIVIENSLSWNAYIDQLIPKLCTAFCAIRTIKPLMSQDTLKLEYYSYFHSLMNYGKIFCRNSSRVFRLQKRVIGIIIGSRPTNSCRELLKK